MKILVVLAAVGIMTALGCQLGISEQEVENIVAEQVADSEERITLKLRDERNRKLADLTGKVDKARDETDDVAEWVDVLLEANAETKEDMAASAKWLLKAVCSTDYLTVTNYTVLFWLVDHLQGGETTIETVSKALNGIKINENYGSTVCNVDDDRHWYLLELPDKVIE